MMSARRAAKHPDLSYDIDGDGAVGPTDYFIGKSFSKEHDHRLNTGERREAVEALEGGWLDNYSFGHEQAGAKRPFPVKQVRGKIISVDNITDLCQVYPPHWNSDKVPRFATATEMAHHRRAERMNAADKLRSEYDEKFPAFVNEPPVPREPTPPVKGLSRPARRELRKQEAREYGGLESENTHINPHREGQSDLTLGYHEVPHDTTRSAMIARRKQDLLENLHETRRQGETDYVPMVVRHTWRDSVEYDDRKGSEQCMTYTKLKDQRRNEGFEHNMKNFGRKPVEHPRYADQREPWWKLQKDYVHDPPMRCALKDVHDPIREVTGKVTEASFEKPEETIDVKTLRPSSLECLPSHTQDELTHQNIEFDHSTLHRWTTEFVPQAIQEVQPRFFDGVKQAPTYSMDTAELDQFSSFEVIANNAKKRTKELQAMRAKEDEQRAESWKRNVRGLPDHSASFDDASKANMDGKSVAAASTIGGIPGLANVTNHVSYASRDPAKPVVPSIAQITSVPRTTVKTGMIPQGEDPPMTERLERLVSGRIGAEHRLAAAEDIVSQRSASPTPGAAGRQESGGFALRTNTDDSTMLKAVETRNTDRTLLKAPGAGSRSGSRRNSEAAGSTVGARPPKPKGVVVRTGGFQWLDRHGPNACPSLVEESSTNSLLNPSRKGSSAQDQRVSPPRSSSRSKLATT
jgi:hypothetical protein